MTKFCSHCGSEISEGATFCLGCGFRVSNTKSSTVKKELFSNYLLSIIGLFLGVIGLLYGILAFGAVGEAIETVSKYNKMLLVIFFTFGFVLIQGLFTLISVAINSTIKKDEKNKLIINTTFILNTIALCVIVLQATILIFGY